MSKIIFIVFLFLNPLFSYSQSDYWMSTNGPHGGSIHDYSFGKMLTSGDFNVTKKMLLIK